MLCHSPGGALPLWICSDGIAYCMAAAAVALSALLAAFWHWIGLIWNGGGRRQPKLTKIGKMASERILGGYY
jgi:hypothetical protein